MRSVLCPELIGRESDLDDIRGALDAAATQRGSALFVVGEAGIGKSRLTREAIAAARDRHFTVLSGRATQAHRTVAFRPLSEALFSYFRDAGPPDLPELEPFRPALARLVPEWRRDGSPATDDSVVLLAEAILRLLRAVGRRQGCLLVLDDLHWADPDTLSIVEYLAENLTSEPVVCLGAVRSEEPSAARDLVHALVARRTATALDLARLDPSGIAAMARACLSASELPRPVDAFLAMHTDGLPFLVEELLAGAVGSGAVLRGTSGWTVEGPLLPDVPLTFLDSVDQRLATLGDAAPVLLAAGVLGRQFDWTLLPEICGLPEQTVLEALRAGMGAQLVVAEPSSTGTFRFRHALTRDAVIERLLPFERAALARRAIGAIETAHPDLPGEWCDLSARLAEHAGDRSRAATLLLVSGHRSIELGALASGEDAFERAHELADEDPVLLADVADARCYVLSLYGTIDRALEVGAVADAALEALGASPERRGNVDLRLARAAAIACRWDVAEEHSARARRWFTAMDDERLLAWVDAVAAHVAFGRGELARADELAARVLAVAERTENRDLTCEALELVGRCARLRDLALAEQAFERSRAVAEQLAMPFWRVRALAELGTIDLLSAGPVTRLERARDMALAMGSLAIAAQIDLQLAWWHLDRAQHEEAVAAARRSATAARRFRVHQLLAMALLAEAAAHGRAGRRDDAEPLVEEALAIDGDSADVAGAAWGTCRAWTSLVEGDRARALRELDLAMGFLRQSSTSTPSPERGLWALLSALADPGDDGDRGAAACAEVRASGAVVHRLARGHLHLADAVLLGRAGQRDGADAAFAVGDEELAPVSWVRHHARTLVAEAAIEDGWGDPVGWLRGALACFEEHGQEPLATAARSLLRLAGAPAPRRAQGGDHLPPALRQHGITAREAEVLGLLADGLGNREIATRLYLSPRTVERHIANMTVKTGLRTRSELVAFAARNVGGTATA